MSSVGGHAVIAFLLFAPPAALAQSEGRIAVEMNVRTVAHLEVSLDNSIAVSPQGHLYLALQTRPNPVIWMLPREGEPFKMRQEWAAYRPRWAATGTRIGFIASIGPPRVWTVEVDPTSGRALDPPRLLIRTSANAFAFAPDGERIALIASRSTAAGASEIHIVNWGNRKNRRLLKESGVIYWLDWSPDGAFIYYGLAPESSADVPNPAHSLRRVRVRGGRAETLLEVGEFLGLAPDGRRILFVPAGLGEQEGVIIAVAGTRGEHETRFRLQPGPLPRWGGGGGGGGGGDGDEGGGAADKLVRVHRGGGGGGGGGRGGGGGVDSADIIEITVPYTRTDGN